MKDEEKSKRQLIAELKRVREQLALQKPLIASGRQTEDELRIERDNLNNILEAMDDGVYIVDQEYNISFVNQALTKEFGRYEGRKCYEYFHSRNDTCPWCKNHEVFKGKTIRWEWTSPKNKKTYDLVDTPLKTPDGNIFKLEIFRDITERKKAGRGSGWEEQLYGQHSARRD